MFDMFFWNDRLELSNIFNNGHRFVSRLYARFSTTKRSINYFYTSFIQIKCKIGSYGSKRLEDFVWKYTVRYQTDRPKGRPKERISFDKNQDRPSKDPIRSCNLPW